MKVLFVDDYEDTAQWLADLAGMPGHEAAITRTANEACEKIHSWVPDLVMVDVWLGDSDGRDLCRLLRRESPLPGCSWVALTGAASEEIECGLFDEILTSPSTSKPQREFSAEVAAPSLPSKLFASSRGGMTGVWPVRYGFHSTIT
jgi:two-component system response regulator VicR